MIAWRTDKDSGLYCYWESLMSHTEASALLMTVALAPTHGRATTFNQDCCISVLVTSSYIN